MFPGLFTKDAVIHYGNNEGNEFWKLESQLPNLPVRG